MRPGMAYAVLIFTALFVAAAHAQDYPASAKQFGYIVVPQGVSFSIGNFTCNGKLEYAIEADGKPQAFLVPSFAGLKNASNITDAKVSPVTEIRGIEDALHCYYAQSGHAESLLPGFSSIHAAIAGVKDARKKGEAGCRTLLGTDRTPCVSFESCQRACYSVTSFCQPVALGAGRDFINVMWTFENDSRALDAAYDREGAAYAAFAQNSSELAAQDYIGAIRAVEEAAGKAEQSQLFYGYSYCFEPDYRSEEIGEILRNASRMYDDSSVFYEMAANAAQVGNATASAMEKQARYRLPELAGDGGNASAGNGTYGADYFQDETAGSQDAVAPLRDAIVEWAMKVVAFFHAWVRGA